MLTVEQNKELVDKYPFLWPRYLNSDNFGEKWEPYNYDYTELDNLPDGWVNSWVPKFLNEVKDILIKKNLLNDYFVVRFVHTLWNKFNFKGNIDIPEITELVKKYSAELNQYCMFCGKEPIYKSTWGFYACKECAKNDFYKTQAMFDDEIKWEDEYENLIYAS